MEHEPTITAARQRIEAAYSPDLARDAGHQMIDMLSDHLRAVEACEGTVLPWLPPPKNIAKAHDTLDAGISPESGRTELVERFTSLVETMLAHGHNLHDPRYIGHQVPASVPMGGLFDAVGSITNQVMAIYDMGPWATAVEWALVEKLGAQIGWQPGQFSGLVTHGGSLANLTALLTARNVSLEYSWERGLTASDKPPVLIVQGDAHYSVARSAGVLGIGSEHVLRVGLDDRRRMDPNQLDELITQLHAKNQPIVAVSACACATPIGAFDPLNEVADVCQRHNVWLHVDAAHGGSASFSEEHRHLLEGIERADSIVWDAHKMLFVPALCAFVLYKNREHKFETFRQDAPYLFDPAAPGLAEYDSGLRTVECTKRAAAFGLWGIWSLFGPGLFADMVDVTFHLGQTLHEKLTAAPDFQPLHDPQCNIVVFRHIPDALRDAPADRLGRFQLELRRRLIESGEFYIVSTNLDGVGALRVTIINPLTREQHLDRLLDALREHAKTLLAE